MKREILLERIDKLKQIMPWYVLEYYQSKLAVPYSFTTLYEYLKEYDRFFSWVDVYKRQMQRKTRFEP